MDKLTPAEQKVIEGILEKSQESVQYIDKVLVSDEKKKKAPEDHVLVISSFRVRLFKKGKLVCDHHMLEVSEIQSSTPLEVVLLSKTAVLRRFTTETAEKCDEILKVLFTLYTNSFPEADSDVIKFTLTPPERFDDILKRVDCKDVGACGGFVSTYRAVCNSLGVPANAVVCWDVGHLYPFNQVVDFNLNEFYQLSAQDLKALLIALQYNHYFKNFYALHFKLGAEGLLMVTDLLQKNLGLEKIDLQYTSCPKESFLHLFSTIQNKKHAISHLDISGNIMQTKGLVALSEFLRNFDHDLKVLRVNNVSGTVRGTEQLLTVLQGNPHLHSNLSQLSLSYNKLDLNTATYALSSLAARASSLTTLELRSTNPVWSMLKNGIPSLTTLDLSENKIAVKDNGVDDVLGFLRGCTGLQNLNMSCCALGPEEVKKLLIDGSPILRVSSLDLADNEFGDEGLITLCQKMYFNSNLRHLSLQGNFKIKSKYRVRALECLTHLIEDNIAIESINISAGLSKSQFKSEVLLFLMSLQNNQSLLKLDIRGHGIGDWGAVVLGQMIQGNTTLRTIKCGDNGFGVKGLRIIKAALQRNNTIVEMPIPMNDIAAILKSDTSQATQLKVQSIVRKVQKMLATNLTLMVRATELSSSNLGVTVTPSSPSPIRNTNPVRNASGSSLNIGANPPATPVRNASGSSLNIGPAPTPGATTPEGPKRVTHVRSVSGTKEVAMTLGLKGNPASVSRWAAKDKSPEPTKANSADISAGIPPLVSKCINFLMEKGYESVGIFRICASASVLKKLKSSMLAGEDVDIFQMGDPDIAAGLLKAYYREVDIPLYPESTHAPFLAAHAIPNIDAAIPKYIEAFQQLPQPTQAVSKKLFQLMHKISQYSAVNMMSPDNISICWAPTMFRSFSTEFIPIVVNIITEYEYIFEGKVRGDTPREEPLEPVAEEPTPEETNDTNDGYEDLPAPPTPQLPHPPTPSTPKKATGGDDVSPDASEIGSATLSRQSWVPNLDSPRSSTALGARLPRRLSLKGASALAGTPAARPTRASYVNNQKYATMVFSQALLNASEEPVA